MGYNEEEKRFLEYYEKARRKFPKVAEPTDIILTACYNYLTAESDREKTEWAWLLTTSVDGIPAVNDHFKIFNDKFFDYAEIKWEKVNRLKTNHQKRRHQKRDDFALTNEQWKETLSYFDNKCAYCGNESEVTYDHFHPFSKGGDFMKGNIIPSCRSCNSSKNADYFHEWYPKQTFYSADRESKILKYIERNKQLTLL